MVTSDSNRTQSQSTTVQPPHPPADTHGSSRIGTIAGLPGPLFLTALAIVLAGALTDNLAVPMVAGFATAMLLGGLLMWLGNLLPVIRDFGLPTILCTFVPAVLVFLQVLPQSVIDVVTTFTTEAGFLDFFVVSLITGSVLGMPRQLLLKAGPRFVLPLLGCISLALFSTGALGALIGFGFREALLYIAAPTMGGGIGIGAIPMSEMYAEQFGGTPGNYLAGLMSAVVLANIFCILIAGLYNGLGKRRQLFAGFNGHGQLLRFTGDKDLEVPQKHSTGDFAALAQGLIIACVLFVAGNLLGDLVPGIHEFAWTIILAALIKIFRLLPTRLEEAASSWNDLATTAWLPTLLVGVSISYIKIGEVLTALRDPLFLLLTASAVLISGVVAGLLGWLLKMNFVEASITPGLAMADTGGSGDVSVLSAADRLHLMPFAQLSTRLGGVVTLLLASLLVPIL
ncbi:2-hydroxycarboxylate transporter family protein [Haloactinomyces albus]|uniref:Na+/citrate or Na+/malate symporter n=1 Tax=Haloactinomyces albus TaxID=1352928 RepID=A0AAE3ZFR8_9ACTN|nr:2-hydroxycarboxylate transporter family protein [Haloactinomyces albus]MDR7304067.1 Na+/citrate or Na+/malate symporter [Haloactinomyces albus]